MNSFSVGGEFLFCNGMDTFSINLCDKIDMTRGYEVILENLSIQPNAWPQIRPDMNMIILTNIHSRSAIQTYVKTGYYYDMTFLAELNSSIQEQEYSPESHPPEIFMEPTVQDVSSPEAQSAKRNIYGGKFEYDEKTEKLTYHSLTNIGVTNIQVSHELGCLIGLGEYSAKHTIITDKTQMPQKFSLLNNNLPLIWVFGNFVKPTTVNDMKYDILKIVPINDNTNQVISKSISNHLYVKTKQANFQQLEVYFKSKFDQDYKLPLNGNVIIILNFQSLA